MKSFFNIANPEQPQRVGCSEFNDETHPTENETIEKKREPSISLFDNDIYKLHEKIYIQLDFFLEKNRVPHIIFYGSHGSGKKTIVQNFIQKIYKNNKQKIKQNVMFVNCAQAKGIKFIREELKFFAKTNVHITQSNETTDSSATNTGVIFKSIILMNADFLTIDAQSALRRCIELFSYNTRFFIIVENKNKLLYPILSRFCEIHIPEYVNPSFETINLHQYYLNKTTGIMDFEKEQEIKLKTILDNLFPKINEPSPERERTILTHIDSLYDEGFSAIDIINYIEHSPDFPIESRLKIAMCFYKIKSEYRNEKLLMLYIFNMCMMPELTEENIYNIL
jgi:hypothetical protein